MSWEFETDGQWPAYRQWVDDHLKGEFKIFNTTETRIDLAVSFSDEMHYLQIEALTLTPPLRVRVGLVVMPM